MHRLLPLLALALAVPALAQPASTKFVGSWSGTIKQGAQDVEIVLHIAPADTGGFRVFVDVPSQNVRGMAAAGSSFAGTALTVPLGGARYEGRIDAAGNEIAGKMIGPGGEEAMSFARTSATPVLPPTEAAVEDPDGLAGDYTGQLQVGGGIDATIHLRRTAAGYAASLDVPAQNAVGLVADSVTVDGASLSVSWGFGSFSGTFSDDRGGIDGTWTQGGRQIELDLTRATQDE